MQLSIVAQRRQVRPTEWLSSACEDEDEWEQWEQWEARVRRSVGLLQLQLQKGACVRGEGLGMRCE